VLAYIKKHVASANGKARLDFILGTHAHSDHIGGFDTLLSDESIIVDRAYLKRYDESKINSFEVEKWDNREVYEQTVEALRARNVPIIYDIEQPNFRLGNMDITLLNTEYDTIHTDIGENDNSIGMLIEIYGKRVFLGADIDNETGDEDRLAPIIGKVDLLKVGHHSYDGSSTDGFLKALMPAVCVVTNNYESSDKSTLDKIKKICNSHILVTGAERGVIAAFYPEGSLKYFNNIM
jgi:beta-lactamase superfamily II metal-dependent hydrolase